jgi:hypothetical protein
MRRENNKIETIWQGGGGFIFHFRDIEEEKLAKNLIKFKFSPPFH